MSLFSIFQISSSAMKAQSQRMNVSASNLANANSVAGPDGQPYRAKQVVFQAMGAEGMKGVKVSEVTEDPSPLRRTYRPDSPFADADGYVMMPNVNPVNEMVNIIEASRSYQANVKVFNTSKKLAMKTLTIGER
ncbi:MAG TPA: flagellar basal body rod protein FlgC [Oleiagrimonas sp.]|nr:flagellar basal body rod protein FlgC [Oleiagrimonas sp.]